MTPLSPIDLAGVRLSASTSIDGRAALVATTALAFTLETTAEDEVSPDIIGFVWPVGSAAQMAAPVDLRSLEVTPREGAPGMDARAITPATAADTLPDADTLAARGAQQLAMIAADPVTPRTRSNIAPEGLPATTPASQLRLAGWSSSEAIPSPLAGPVPASSAEIAATPPQPAASAQATQRAPEKSQSLAAPSALAPAPPSIPATRSGETASAPASGQSARHLSKAGQAPDPAAQEAEMRHAARASVETSDDLPRPVDSETVGMSRHRAQPAPFAPVIAKAQDTARSNPDQPTERPAALSVTADRPVAAAASGAPSHAANPAATDFPTDPEEAPFHPAGRDGLAMQGGPSDPVPFERTAPTRPDAGPLRDVPMGAAPRQDLATGTLAPAEPPQDRRMAAQDDAASRGDAEKTPLGNGQSAARPLATTDMPQPVPGDARSDRQAPTGSDKPELDAAPERPVEGSNRAGAQPASSMAAGSAILPAMAFAAASDAAEDGSRSRAEDAIAEVLASRVELAPHSASRPALAAAPGAASAQHSPSIGHQIGLALSTMPDGPVEISLSPEELGKVRLTLHARDQGMAVTIQAERPETLDLMRRHIDSLARDMRDLGFSSLSFSFDQRPGQQQFSQRAEPGLDIAAEPAPHAPEAVTSTAPPVRSISPQNGLDIRF